jgi:hypothetical protein
VPVDHIIVRDAFTFAHKFILKKLWSSDWLALNSSNWIASVGKALDSDSIFIMPDQWRKIAQKAEIGDSIGEM